MSAAPAIPAERYPVRVMVLPAWDTATIQIDDTATVAQLKREALRATRKTAADEQSYLVKYRGAPVLVVVGCWCGPLGEGERATQPLREIATPIADLSGAMPFVAAQQLFDADYPSGGRYYWKSLFLRELGDEAVQFIREIAAERPTPASTVELWALGGAISRVQPEATAFFYRDARWLLTIEANSLDAATDEANIAWVRRRYDDAMRFTSGGTYFNFAGFLEGGEELLLVRRCTREQFSKQLRTPRG